MRISTRVPRSATPGQRMTRAKCQFAYKIRGWTLKRKVRSAKMVLLLFPFRREIFNENLILNTEQTTLWNSYKPPGGSTLTIDESEIFHATSFLERFILGLYYVGQILMGKSVDILAPFSFQI